MTNTYVLGFYKYVSLENPSNMVTTILDFCKSNDMRGNILIGKEGINASISGSRKAINQFKKFITSIDSFKDLFFKEEETFEHPFKKMKVKLRKEIVTFDHSVDLSQAGEHISAQQLSELYDKKGNLKDNVILLDARNNYEYRIGKFKEATHLDIRYFRNFTKELKKIKDIEKKKVVMYCTGGIRCEKASAYLKSQGIKEVFQLNQGIIQFGKETTKNIWEGKCFVFDKRMVSDINSQGPPISTCHICKKKCDFQRNCKNLDCNLFYVSCIDCESNLHGCCSKECKNNFQNQRRALAKLSIS